MSRTSKPRILFLLLEFPTWDAASKWPYNALFGLEEGLHALDIEPTLVTSPWLPRLPAICDGQQFDQVWMEVAHQNVVHRGWLEWVASLAPVRVGFVPESLEYTADEIAVMPQLALRRHGIETRLKYMTHVMAVDERDAALLNARPSGPRALWWPMNVPRQFLASDGAAPAGKPAIFPGTPYGPRQAFLSHPSLKGLLGHLAPPEAQTIYPQLFDGLQTAASNFAGGALADWAVSMAEYLQLHRRIRRTTFGMWLEGIRSGSALVNLPHPVKTYASRVYEGMAAGRPVISWDLPERPRNRAMFEPGSEILLFDRDAPEQLAEHIQRIQREPAFGAGVAERALKKLRRFHTAEQRVKHILSWIETGAEPVYA